MKATECVQYMIDKMIVGTRTADERIAARREIWDLVLKSSLVEIEVMDCCEWTPLPEDAYCPQTLDDEAIDCLIDDEELYKLGAGLHVIQGQFAVFIGDNGDCAYWFVFKRA